MAKIDALDFTKYVESNRQIAIDILKAKNVDIEKTSSLSNIVNKINYLPDRPVPDDEYFGYPQEYKALLEDYENDPLLTRNGGEYTKCVFYGLENRYDTTYLYLSSVTSNCRIITSDGQDITQLTTNFMITWDVSKDLTRENGNGWRWIKLYYSGTNANAPTSGCYPDMTTDYLSPLFFLLIDGWSVAGSVNNVHWGSIKNSPIECLVIGYNTNSIHFGSTSVNTENYNKITYLEHINNLKYFKSYSNQTCALTSSFNYPIILKSGSLIKHISEPDFLFIYILK